jgi:hypothetical protein
MNEAQKFIEELTLPPTKSDAPSVYAFSLHKSGSTLLYNMLSELAGHTDMAYFSLQDQIFANGIPNNVEIPGTQNIFKENGYIYGGFRFLPTSYEIPNLCNHKKILLIRNPLDVLVSLYFSRKSSHKIPEKGKLREMWKKKREKVQNEDINDFVLNEADKHLKRMESYNQLLSDVNLRIYRYEDIIYDKKEFIHGILDFFEINVAEKKIDKVVDKHDVFPEAENESEHVRQVHPGNYKKHLAKSTIDTLNLKFGAILAAFGYLPSAKCANFILNSGDGANK